MDYRFEINVTIRYVEKKLKSDTHTLNTYIQSLDLYKKKPLDKKALKEYFSEITESLVTNTISEEIKEYSGAALPSIEVSYNGHRLEFISQRYEISEQKKILNYKIPHIETIVTNEENFEKNFEKYYQKKLRNVDTPARHESHKENLILLDKKYRYTKTFEIHNNIYKIRIWKDDHALLGLRIFYIELSKKEKILGVPYYKTITTKSLTFTSDEIKHHEEVQKISWTNKTPQELFTELTTKNI